MAVLKSNEVAGFVAYMNFKYSWTYSDLGLGLEHADSTRLVTEGTFQIGGAIYDSAYDVRWSTDFTGAGFDKFRAVFGGLNLSEGDDGLNGGTIMGIHFQAQHGGQWKTLYDLTQVSAAANFVSPFFLDGRFDWILENWLLDEDDRMFLSRGDDQVSGFEGNDWINGKGGNDLLAGGEGNDRLFGGKGEDRLAGEVGNDRLLGQDGNDRLIGHKGADLFKGGAGIDRMFLGGDTDRDRVVFHTVSDSAKRAADRVFGFDTGEDVLDFRRFDGDAKAAGHQDLVFGGPSAIQNGIWTETKGSDVRLLADVTGDSKADFVLLLKGTDSIGADDILL